MAGVLAIWLALAWLIALLYRLAPSRALPRSGVWPGAALAAIVVVGLAYAFPLYTELTAQLSSTTRLVAWSWCIAQAVLLGAVFNRVRRTAVRRIRELPMPAPPAAPPAPAGG